MEHLHYCVLLAHFKPFQVCLIARTMSHSSCISELFNLINALSDLFCPENPPDPPPCNYCVEPVFDIGDALDPLQALAHHVTSVGFLDHAGTMVDVLCDKLLFVGLCVEVGIFHPVEKLLNKDALFSPLEEPKELLFSHKSPTD